MNAIVLDIEGTTTPIAFVYDVLFPYARLHLREYLRNPDNHGALLEPSRRLEEELAAEQDASLASRKRQMEGDGIAAYVEWLMDHDRKSPGLKLLQGQIWERGYRSGELHGEVFADVPGALQRWRDAGIPVAIYSSGSELAQRLLFGSTAHGDLTPLIACFFDTSVGAKISPDSYRRIASELGRPAERMLFISDVTTELDAASAAACQTRLCVRPGNHPQVAHSYPVIRSLDEIATEFIQ